jgi:hypothetical protein
MGFSRVFSLRGSEACEDTAQTRYRMQGLRKGLSIQPVIPAKAGTQQLQVLGE